MQPLPLEQLIGGPLRALVLAQGIAAQATAQFVSEVGFLPPAQGAKEPQARTVNFTYMHPVPNPENPGAVIETPVRVSVPLLALTSIPNVRVAEATVNLQANVVDLRPAEKQAEEIGVARRPESLFDPPVRIFAVYAAPPKPDAPPSAGLSFSIRVVREPLTEGMNKIVTLLQDAITSEALKK